MINPVGAASRAISPATDAASDAARLLDARRGRGGVDVQGLADDIAAIRSGGDAARADALASEVGASLSPVEQGQFTARLEALAAAAGPSPASLAADVTQIGLDIAGIFDPTPISDGSNAVISLIRGDWGGAALSAVGIIPYLGDAAKLGKLGKWAETVVNTAELAARDPGFLKQVRPALEGIQSALGKVKIDELPLPQFAKDHLARIKSSVDETLAPATRKADEAAAPAAREIGVRTFDNADDFNRAANDALPNTRYEYGNYSYTTDAQGRVTTAEGKISLDPVHRNDPDLQAQIGNEGRDTDVGFHLIADRFGGQTNRLNVVPGNGMPTGDGLPNLNTGAYKRFENSVAKLAENPANRVEVKIETRYDAGNASTRPDEFVASYRVNGGQWRTQTFDNK